MTNGVIDVATQLFTGLAPIYLLFNLHLPLAKKLPGMLAFTPNLTSVAPKSTKSYTHIAQNDSTGSPAPSVSVQSQSLLRHND